MKISVITATIDSDERLARTIASVESQTHRDIEHIIVDGRDGRHIPAKDGRKVFGHQRKGVYEALNFGISKASGDIVGLVHGGDLLASPDILEKVAEAFRADPSLDFIYGDIRFFNPVSGHKGRIYHASRFTPRHLAYGMAPPHPSMYLRRELAERIGPYHEDYRIAGDLDMWMRLFADKSIKFRYVPEIIVEMATGGASGSLKARLVTNNREKLIAMRRNGYSPNPLMLLGKYMIIARDALNSPRKDNGRR